MLWQSINLYLQVCVDGLHTSVVILSECVTLEFSPF